MCAGGDTARNPAVAAAKADRRHCRRLTYNRELIRQTPAGRGADPTRVTGGVVRSAKVILIHQDVCGRPLAGTGCRGFWSNKSTVIQQQPQCSLPSSSYFSLDLSGYCYFGFSHGKTPPEKPDDSRPTLRCCGQKPHQEGMGTKEGGISNKGGPHFFRWLVVGGRFSLDSGCAAHRGGRRQRRRTKQRPRRAPRPIGRYSRWPSLLFNLPHPWAPQEEGRGIAGGFFLSRRKGVHTGQGAQPSRGEGRKRGAALGNHSERQERGGRLCEGQDHSRHWRGWHGDWLPRRPPVGIVARARDLCCARFGGGGGKFEEGTDARAYQEHRTAPKPQKTPHTPDVRTGRKEQSSKGQKGKGAGRAPQNGREERPWVSPIVVGAVPQPTRPQTGAPPAPRQGEDALRTPHHPRPVSASLSRGWRAGSNGPPTANPAAPPLAPPATLAGRLRPRGGPAPASPLVGTGPQPTRPRAGAARPRGQGRQPLRRPGSQDPQSLPRFRGREPERQGLPRGGGGHARARRLLRPGPRGRRGRGPTSRGPRTARARPRPAPTASSTRGSPPARPQPKVAPPIVVGAGPQPPRPRPGPSLGRPPGKNGPFGGNPGRAAPVPYAPPRPARAQGAEGGKPEPAPARGRRGRLTGRSSHPPPSAERARGRRGKGKGSPSRQTGAGGPCTAGAGAAGPTAAAAAAGSRGVAPPPPAAEAVPLSLSAQALSHHDRAQARPCPSGRGKAPSGVRQGHARIPRHRPRPERAPGADGGKPEPTPVLRKTRQGPGQARARRLGPRGRGQRRRRRHRSPQAHNLLSTP
ncbi:hypothetical protein C7M84_018238 [Penaeus vannamei]|uniref:Uncharacterized protein n=1 Tax=Penaeus vannamei TaxID=6689 RepID=A0A3R7P8J5_PENVA|nr:hypothetical protein C7M84_018238 [Penaeus vannamei]